VTASRRPRSTATRARGSVFGHSTTSRRAAPQSLSPRRSHRAASTSRSCRTSSTTSCRWSPRTTSTASAERDGPDQPATRSRSSASTSGRSSARSSRCSAIASRPRSSRASNQIARSGRSRSASGRRAARVARWVLAAADRTSAQGGRTSALAGPIRVALARSGTLIAPVRRSDAAPAPRRMPAMVARVGVPPRSASATLRRVFAGLAPRRAGRPRVDRSRADRHTDDPPRVDLARIGPRQRATVRVSIVRIDRRSCQANGYPATGTADRATDRVCDRATDRVCAGWHTAAGTGNDGRARGKLWTPGSCLSRMTRRSAR
jgi:hypothetical protein